MAGFLSVTNWHEYQHYRDRTPIWVKFYVEILHDEKLKKLPIPTRLLWDQMLLLAATFQNSVPNSPELIAELTGIPPETCREAIQDLLQGRWLREKTTRRAASKPVKAQKRERVEREKNAHAKAVLEAAEKYVRASAYFVDDQAITRALAAEYQLTDQVTVRRLLAVAADSRSAA